MDEFWIKKFIKICHKFSKTGYYYSPQSMRVFLFDSLKSFLEEIDSNSKIDFLILPANLLINPTNHKDTDIIWPQELGSVHLLEQDAEKFITLCSYCPCLGTVSVGFIVLCSLLAACGRAEDVLSLADV